MDEFYILENCNLINSKNVCELYLDFCIAITDCDSKIGGKRNTEEYREFFKRIVAIFYNYWLNSTLITAK